MGLHSSWMNPKLELRESAIHSKGIFAREDINKDDRVAIFGGQVMLIDEIDDLPEKYQEYPMQIEERFVLGLRNQEMTEDTDFFNHSCNPNCGFKGQIFLVAMRDIQKGEEITFDYAMIVSPSVGSDIVFSMDCACGAKNCRKSISENDWRLPGLRKRYAGYFSQYLQEKIGKEYPDLGE
jgi:uncharacterized protein